MSSRQQLRTQGEGTEESVCVGGECRSGIQINAGAGGCCCLCVFGGCLAATVFENISPVVLAACIKEHGSLMFASLATMSAFFLAPILDRLLPANLVFPNVCRVH